MDKDRDNCKFKIGQGISDKATDLSINFTIIL